MFKKGACYFTFIAFLLLFFSCENRSSENYSDLSDSIFHDPDAYRLVKNKTNRPKTFKITDYIDLELDSLSSVKVMDHLKEGKQLLLLDGAGRFNIDPDHHQVIIYTGMMKLSTEGVDFHINAYSSSPGQSFRVFKGQLIATKSYTSDFPNTDTLHRGEMILINRDIDLMEKETFDTTKAMQ